MSVPSECSSALLRLASVMSPEMSPPDEWEAVHVDEWLTFVLDKLGSAPLFPLASRPRAPVYTHRCFPRSVS